jgi:hypothetical protein
VDEARLDRALLADMAIARAVVALGHATRAAANLKVRQPLARAVAVVAPEQQAGLVRMGELVTDELNVKTLDLARNEAELITYKLLPNNRLLGPRFGSRFPQLRAALAAADPFAAVAGLRAGQPLALQLDSDVVQLTAEEVLVNPQPKPGFAVSSEAGVVVALDTALTPELRAEGWAREVVRRIQDLRKSAGLEISDRVVTYVTASPDLAAALQRHAGYVKAETLSVDLFSGEAGAVSAPTGAATATDAFDGETLTIGLVKANMTTTPEVFPEHPGPRPGDGGTAGGSEGQMLALELDAQLSEQRALLTELFATGRVGLASLTPYPLLADLQTRLAEQQMLLGSLIPPGQTPEVRDIQSRLFQQLAARLNEQQAALTAFMATGHAPNPLAAQLSQRLAEQQAALNALVALGEAAGGPATKGRARKSSSKSGPKKAPAKKASKK